MMRTAVLFVALCSAVSAQQPGPNPVKSTTAEVDAAHKGIYQSLKPVWDVAQFSIKAVPNNEAIGQQDKYKITPPKEPGAYVRSDVVNFLSDDPMKGIGYVTDVDGVAVSSFADLTKELSSHKAGDVVDLKYMRLDGEVIIKGKVKSKAKWSRDSVKAKSVGLMDGLRTFIRTHTDPVDGWTRTEATDNGPAYIYLHRTAGDRTGKVMLRVMYSGRQFLDVQEFKISLGGKTSTFPAKDVTKKTRTDGLSLVFEESIVVDITDDTELLARVAGLYRDDQNPRIVRFTTKGEFVDEKITASQTLGMIGVVHTYYADRFGK